MKNITAKVYPNSREASVKETEKGILEIRVKSVPEKGKANKEAAAAIADFLGIPKSAVKIAKGSRSKNKVFTIDE